MKQNLHSFLLGLMLVFVVVFEGKSQRTYYVNGFLYENGILKSFGLPNGRMVNVKQADNSYKLEYEYHYTDHIGNLRLAFRVKTNKKEYKLTGEENVYSEEIGNFGFNATTNQGGYTKHTRVGVPVRTGEKSIPLGLVTNEINKQSRVFKRVNMTQGTKLDMTSYAYYPSSEIGIGIGDERSTPPPAPPLLGGVQKTSPSGTGLALGGLLSVGSTQIGEQKAPQVQLNILAAIPLLKKLFAKQTNKVVEKPIETPQIEFDTVYAGMRYKFYDENGDVLYTQTVNVGTISPEQWGKLQQTFTAPTSGLMEVEIFNYNQDAPVFFDDWHIVFSESNSPEIVQEMHYDPWGLPMQEECYSTPNDTDFTFNGKELQTFADLYLYDYHWRQYDPQLGRWHNVDPSADSYHGLSPYNYCFNNPVMTIDPDGREPVTLTVLAVAAIIGGTINVASNWSAITAGGGFNWGMMAGSFALGATVGGLGVVAAPILAPVLGTGFWLGAGLGLGSGFLLGVGNTGLKGGSFSDALSTGLSSGVTGMFTGGIISGLSSVLAGNSFWTGKPPLTVVDTRMRLTEMNSKKAGITVETPVHKPQVQGIVEPPAHPQVSSGNGGGGGFHQPSVKGINLKSDFKGFSAGKLDPVKTPLGKLNSEIGKALENSGWVKDGYTSGSTWHTTFYKETGVIYRTGFKEYHVLDWNPGSTGGVHGNGVGYFKLFKNSFDGNVLYRATTNPNFRWNAGSHPPVYINGIKIN